MKHKHGGDIYRYQDCLDFSINCNPLGTPKRVIQAGIDSMNRVYAYPEVGYHPLREKLAQYEGVEPRQVICGNGAAELIFTLCHALAPKKALLMAPTFAEYQQALESVGCEIVYYDLKRECEFQAGEDFLERIHAGLDIVFLCNPNNPTGMLTERTFLLKMLEKCKNEQIFLVVDECFLDFVREPEAYTLKGGLKDYKNLFLLKAFTKRYSMAGIRLGYGLSGNEELLEKMENCVQPWNISAIAQNCGMAALDEDTYLEQGRQIVFMEREYLKAEMTKLGFKVYNSQANYLFFEGPKDLYERCIRQKVLIRDCSNYRGLRTGYYRVSVQQHPENECLLRALRAAMRETGE